MCLSSHYCLSKTTEYDEELKSDHYSRYFHALTLLKVPKNTELVPKIGTNLAYNAAYTIWMLDDGSDKAWDAICDSMWYMSEATKDHFDKEGLRVGWRPKYF